LPQPQPNSLVDLAFALVQNQLLHFVTAAHYPSWHFADFQHAQQILQNQFRVLKSVFYYVLPPLDYFTKHHPADDCTKRNQIIVCPFEKAITPVAVEHHLG